MPKGKEYQICKRMFLPFQVFATIKEITLGHCNAILHV